jgi:hypothetical protein
MSNLPFSQAVHALRNFRETVVLWCCPVRSVKSEPMPGRKSRVTIEKKPSSGPRQTSIADVNESIRQARGAVNEATRKFNLSSAQVLKTYLRLRPHEQLVKLFDGRLTSVDRRRLLVAIKDAIPNRPLSRSPVGPHMKARAMYSFRNSPVIVIVAMFASVLGVVAFQGWRNTARVLTFPERPLVLVMPDGSSRSVIVPSGTRLAAIEHDHGVATVRIWKNKIGYVTSQVQLTVQ